MCIGFNLMNVLGKMFFSDRCELDVTVFLPFCVFIQIVIYRQDYKHIKLTTAWHLKRETDGHCCVSYLMPSNLSLPTQVIIIWCSARKQQLNFGEQTVCVLFEFLYLWIFCSSQSDIYVFTLYSSVLTIHYFWNWRLIKSWIHLNWQLARCHVIST